MVTGNRNLRSLLETCRGLEVVVIGEAMLDSYLHGRAERLCREAPVPIVQLSKRADVPGGAANTAAGVQALGGRVTFLSVVGDDDEGARLQEALRQRGVGTGALVVDPSRRTLVKQRVFADGQMALRLDQGTTAPLGPQSEDILSKHLAAVWARADAIIISDYGYGVLTPRLRAALASLQQRWPRILAADAKNLALYRELGVTAVKPNYAEAARLLGLAPCAGEERLEQLAGWESRLLELTGAHLAAVTLDASGALIFEEGRPPHRTYARPQPNAKAAGAGDTFISALTLALAAGASVPSAAELASAAAGVVVGKGGTTSCTAGELYGQLAAEDKVIADRDELTARLEFLRVQGKRIVFTSGCFDILHRGHITYLNRAKTLGDVLMVGLNADESVRRLKGAQRPINPLEDRAEVLAGLSCIDHIIPFGEDTPEGLLEVIRPQLFVKGGDYSRATLPETPLVERLGGEVRILPYLEDKSTSSIIARVRAAYGPQVAGGA
jgi:D-beta-D-heptose 7-phosphate kinase/D-beta-D-heptose 1-phosphate adenosyltransferase